MSAVAIVAHHDELDDVKPEDRFLDKVMCTDLYKGSGGGGGGSGPGPSGVGDVTFGRGGAGNGSGGNGNGNGNGHDGASPNGAYVVQFYKNSEWTPVLVDDRMPTGPYGNPLYGSSAQRSEMWVSLLEKGFAKYYGGYEVGKRAWRVS